MRNKMIWIMTLLVFAGLNACSTVPGTDRKRLNLVTTAKIAELSAPAYQELIESSSLVTAGPQAERLRLIGQKIAESAEKFMRESNMEDEIQYYSWEFNLIQDDMINAFCMPGGKIAFYTGILELFENDDQLAVVMGHEIAHAVAKHGNERMSQQLLVNFGGQAIDSLFAEKPEETRALISKVYNTGTTVGVLLPYSRTHEFEADEIGTRLMFYAGYDISQALRFWEIMQTLPGERPPEFLSTHPAPESRIDHLRQVIDRLTAEK